jgi:DNA segregation ATPase FtsK/SpoIIIE, S-DNA-T family
MTQVHERHGTRVPERSALLGLDDQRRSPVIVDLAANPLFLVLGPDQSGRSTALATLATSLLDSTPQLEAHVLSTRRTPLSDGISWTSATIGNGVPEQLAELRTRIDSRANGLSPDDTAPLLIVIDDGDDLVEGAAPPLLEVLVKRARDSGVIVLASMTTFKAARAFCQWVPLLRSNRQGLLLQPGDDDGELFATRLPRRTGLALPPGRGYLFTRGTPRLIQVAQRTTT